MYQIIDLGNGREAIHCSSGRTCHIVQHEDGMWTVEEDKRQANFLNRRSALDCARELAGDPDQPPLGSGCSFDPVIRPGPDRGLRRSA
jgi:hypothetical protein